MNLLFFLFKVEYFQLKFQKKKTMSTAKLINLSHENIRYFALALHKSIIKFSFQITVLTNAHQILHINWITATYYKLITKRLKA